MKNKSGIKTKIRIEFNLDPADQLLEHVFEGDHADNAAILVQQHRQVNAVALKFKQELIEAQGDG